MSDTPFSLDDHLQRMRDAHRSQPMPAWPDRARRLQALEALMLQHRNEIAAAINADFGCRPHEETDLLEIYPSLSAVRHALARGRRWMKPRRRLADLLFLPASTELRPQPLGVVGIIVPWNYPLYLAIGPLVDALVAGNRAMVKMSEYTPRFSALFAELVAQHFTPDEVVVINGDAKVAQAFSSLPFNHLLFTGSTAVGRHVMRAAAANLTPVTLELGGKSPAIIGPDAHFERAVERIVFGKLVNAGQTCIAPDYVLLPRSRVGDFIAAARATVNRLYPDIGTNAQYASVVTDAQYQRLIGLRDAAVAAGARAEVLGSGSDPAQPRRLLPTLLIGVQDSMRVMHEEIFGPLLPVVAYDTLDQAIGYVAARPHPLALYLFERNRTAIEKVLSGTIAGGVTVNDTLYHIAQHKLPFGGIGPSGMGGYHGEAGFHTFSHNKPVAGMGGYHGEAGFRTFSHAKPVMRQARLNGAGLLNPPYGARFRGLLKALFRLG